MGRFTPPQLLIISFLCVILLGATVLSLPMATKSGERLSVVDSLFTATSATCVTGLVVTDTGTRFSPFGRWIIFLLFQAGGLGIMTFSTLFAVLLGRKIGFVETEAIKVTLDKQNILGLKKLITYILGITFITEIIGASALFFRWKNITDWPMLKILEQSIFHSVSGFCNAGFSLLKTSLTGFSADPVINITMMFLIFLGGIGFIVIMDLIGLFTKKGVKRKISLQSKVVLVSSIALILIGAGVILFFEGSNLLKEMSLQNKMLVSFFQSVTARTAGFNTIDIGKMTVPSLFFIISLMFIGASPGSTGGGIKTCTFMILVASIYSFLRNKKKVRLFNRSIPEKVVKEAFVIFFLSLTCVFVVTLMLVYVNISESRLGGNLIKILFETVSAFGTVGLSTGITAGLNDVSKIILVITMFAGRLGPLTLALAIAFKDKKENFHYPEENIMIG